jgi:hypothetical protein
LISIEVVDLPTAMTLEFRRLARCMIFVPHIYVVHVRVTKGRLVPEDLSMRSLTLKILFFLFNWGINLI